MIGQSLLMMTVLQDRRKVNKFGRELGVSNSVILKEKVLFLCLPKSGGGGRFLLGSDGPAIAFIDHSETTSKLFEASKDNYLVLFVSGTQRNPKISSFKLILIFLYMYKSSLLLVLSGPETPLDFFCMVTISNRKCNKIGWDSFFHFSLGPESCV